MGAIRTFGQRCHSGRAAAAGDRYCRANLVLAAAAAALIALAALAEAGPGGIYLFGRRLPETCLHRVLTGRPCPGCGMGRSIVLAVQLRLGASRATHPAGVFLAAWLLAQAAARVALALVRPKGRRAWIADVGVSSAGFVAAVNLGWLIPP